MKKRKTPRTGVPPVGYLRVVMDYPIGEDTPYLTYDIDRGHCVGQRDNKVLAPYGNLIRLIKRTGDGE
jgi:hypothetical protein